MALTKKYFIEYLKRVHDETEIVGANGQPIVHFVNIGNKIVLSDEKPVGYCGKCGEYAYRERELTGYTGYCPNEDENLFAFEITPLSPTKAEDGK
jgi:hypothetical protein